MVIKLGSPKKSKNEKINFIKLIQNKIYPKKFSLEKINPLEKHLKFIDNETVFKNSGLGFEKVSVGIHLLIDLGKKSKQTIRKLASTYQEDLPIFYDIDRFNIPLAIVIDLENHLNNGDVFSVIEYNDLGSIFHKILAQVGYDLAKFSQILYNSLGEKKFILLKSDNVPIWKYLSPNPLADCYYANSCINNYFDER